MIRYIFLSLEVSSLIGSVDAFNLFKGKMINTDYFYQNVIDEYKYSVEIRTDFIISPATCYFL